MLREQWSACPYMYTLFCAKHLCKEQLPCAGMERPSCVRTLPGETDCEADPCPCWSYAPPPLARVARYIRWCKGQLAIGRELPEAGELAFGKSVGWLSLAPAGGEVITDEEVVVYASQLTEIFTAGLCLGNAGFFEEGGSFLGTARSYNPARQ